METHNVFSNKPTNKTENPNFDIIDKIAVVILLKLIDGFFHIYQYMWGGWALVQRGLQLNYYQLNDLFLKCLKARKQEWRAEPYFVWFFPSIVSFNRLWFWLRKFV